MGLVLNYDILDMPLEFTFTISRSSRTDVETVLVRLRYETGGKTYEGLGESVPSEFYGETPATVSAFYEQLNTGGTLNGLTPFDIQKLTARFDAIPGHYAAKAGIDMAMYDLQGHITGMPVWKLLGLDPDRAPKTSYTIGIADIGAMREKTRIALGRGYDILKIKLGTPQDRKVLRMIREEAPDATVRADANAGWTLAEALAMGDTLAEYDVEFVEEPLVLESSEADHLRLKESCPVPVMADESCKRLPDIPRCARLFDAINLKHTKTGGLSEALRMIHAARAHNLKIMLGGFCESSVSVTAFAHLAPLVDYCDLDAALLVGPADPYTGVRFEGSRVILPTTPGLGVHPKQ